MTTMRAATFRDKTGAQAELPVDISMYREAASQGLTLPQYINNTYPTTEEASSSTFDQLCASSGLILLNNREFGLRPPSVQAVLDGRAIATAGPTVVDAVPASRILYPAVMLEMIGSQMPKDLETDPAAFSNMLAIDQTVLSNRYERPVVNIEGSNKRAKAISQLAPPQVSLKFTTADSAGAIPTRSIAMEFSDQALAATTIDFVGMCVKRQRQTEANANASEYLLGCLSGDADLGNAALSATNADVYDSTISADATITKKALIGWLLHNYSTRRITHIVTDQTCAGLLEAILVSTHTGIYVQGSLTPQLMYTNRLLSTIALHIIDGDVVTWPANTLMGLDKSGAIQRYTNVNAAYTAIEQFVLRRSNVLRYDFGEVAYPLFSNAFDVLTLLNT